MIWVILLTIAAALLQVSAFSILGFGFVVLQPLNLLFSILFHLENENNLFWSMLVGALLLETFSTRPFGNFLLIYLLFFLIGIVYLHTTEKLAKFMRSLAFVATTTAITTFFTLLWQNYPFWPNLGISLLNSLANGLMFLLLLKIVNRFTIDERHF